MCILWENQLDYLNFKIKQSLDKSFKGKLKLAWKAWKKVLNEMNEESFIESITDL